MNSGKRSGNNSPPSSLSMTYFIGMEYSRLGLATVRDRQSLAFGFDAASTRDVRRSKIKSGLALRLRWVRKSTGLSGGWRRSLPLT